ncbi:MAG: helix-turn-helix domain-containing protein [Acidimicrobiales bacterium]
MVRPSPQTARVVAVMEILSARPEEALTLAEITRRLGVNKSSCYSMLGALTEAGWLLRDPFRKTYRLGPALVAVGRAASAGLPALEFIRPALIEICRSVGSHGVALAVGPDAVTVVDQVRDLRAQGGPIPHGFIPLRPPFGAAVAAWARPETTRTWLDRAPPDTADRYAAALEAVRRRGYVVELAEAPLTAPADGATLPEVVERLARVLTPEVLPIELDRARSYSVSAINAPVLDGAGDVVLVASLMGFSTPLTGAEIESTGQRLRAAAASVSIAIGAPVSDP